MQDDRSSLFRMYSLGIVMEDKKVDTDYVKVYPVEQLPYIDGPISEYKPKYEFSMPNIRGVEQKFTLEGSAIIVAKWLASDSNRMTSPMVHKGESVEIYRYADTDKYYWKTNAREPSLRKKEIVCHGYSNVEDPLKPFNKESSYWHEIDTINKTMTVSTSKSDGEKYKYTVKIDAKNNVVYLSDDVGNTVMLNSENGSVNVKATKSILAKVEGTELKVSPSGVEIKGSLKVSGNIESNGKVVSSGGFYEGGIKLNAP